MAITRTIPEVTTTKGEAPELIYCLSTDTKPTDASNGSLLIEIDTGDKYLFDAAGETWYEYA